ncbi:PREDICTED: coiled-coil domain-containing protein 40 [Cyprinodon variegatus]|uniref:coiled-coil domain-containing protein 40 n=1 Tax=Cyprinodon variegatus TaxID=28743 RepID=UPI0007428F3C|nr:PREDICTED: coiled-coil domain-containing protein 40 [Cyprinodon variegatus]
MTALAPHQLSLDASEDEADQETPQDEKDTDKEAVILDLQHPLNKRFNDALRLYLQKKLEKTQLELKKELIIGKDDDRLLTSTRIEISQLHTQQARAEHKLSDIHQAKALAQAQWQQAQDRLETAKSKYSNLSSQSSQAKTKVSRLQAELEKTSQQVVFAQAVSEGLYSNVKIINNAKHKVDTEKTQAEEEKKKQDLYVEHLTKDLENRTLLVAEYELQGIAQVQETQETTKALSEAEMHLESLLMMHKKLLQQWNGIIIDIKKHSELVNTMQEDLREVEAKAVLLGRDIEGYKKSNKAEQEKNESLTVQLNSYEMDCETWKKLISNKQMAQMELQAQYSACQHSLSETKLTLTTLTKEMSTNQTKLSNQRKQVEKLSATCLELEENIMDHMQQQLTHSKAATYSKQLISKMATQKKEKMNQLLHLERDILKMKLEYQNLDQTNNILTLTVEKLDEEIKRFNKLMTLEENSFSSTVLQIKQKETEIIVLEKRISHIVESTGHDDLSPLEIKIKETLADIQELDAQTKKDQHLWMLQQGTLVGLTRELEANSKKIRKLQQENTVLQQEEIRQRGQIKEKEREQAELDKNSQLLRRDLKMLYKLMEKNQQLSEALKLESTLMETDFIDKLKEAEEESVGVQMKIEWTQEEKENLARNVLVADLQIELWKKKTQILKETQSVLDTEICQESEKMKAAIRRMELRISQLKKQQQQLMRESELAVAKRENLDLRKETMLRSSRKERTKEELSRSIQGLKRKIKITRKEIADCELVIKELENRKTILSEKIQQQKQHLCELSCTSSKLDDDLVKLQDNKMMSQAYLIALQNRNKKLEEVFEGKHKVSSNNETVIATLQSRRQTLEAYRNIFKRNWEDLSEHREALCNVIQVVEAYIQISQL